MVIKRLFFISLAKRFQPAQRLHHQRARFLARCRRLRGRGRLIAVDCVLCARGNIDAICNWRFCSPLTRYCLSALSVPIASVRHARNVHVETLVAYVVKCAILCRKLIYQENLIIHNLQLRRPNALWRFDIASGKSELTFERLRVFFCLFLCDFLRQQLQLCIALVPQPDEALFPRFARAFD